MSFGKNIGYYRKQLKITQEELAEKLYVSRQTISRWETDSVFPDVETIIKLCELFGCDMDTLVRGDAEAKAYAETVEPTEENASVGEAFEEDREEEESKEKREHISKLEKRSRIAGRVNEVICSVVMTVAAFFYVIYGLLQNVWHPTWVIFIIGVGICAVSSIITDAIG